MFLYLYVLYHINLENPAQDMNFRVVVPDFPITLFATGFSMIKGFFLMFPAALFPSY